MKTLLKIKFSFSVWLLAGLCGCATLQKRPWTEAIYENGDVYILDGVETLKTTDLPTADGTSKEFTVAVQRNFKVYRNSDKKVIWDHILQNNGDCDSSSYDYFANDHALLVSGDGSPGRISNLNTGKSFRVNGILVNRSQTQCKYALVWNEDHAAARFFVYNKLTGQSMKLSPKAIAFIGKTWESRRTELFLDNSGTRLFKTACHFLSKEKQFQFMVSIWDLTQEKLLMESPVILARPYQSLVSPDPIVLFVKMTGDKLFILFEWDPADYGPGCLIKEAIVTPNECELKDLYATGRHLMDVKVIEDDSDTVTIFSRIVFGGNWMTGDIGRTWSLNRYNLNSGESLRQEVIKLPDQSKN